MPAPRVRPAARLGLAALAALAFSVTARARHADLLSPRFQFDPGLAVDASIPTPAEFLGYELGTQFTYTHDVVRYIHALADASDRVTVQEYGRTYEDRPLHLLTVTSPENHANLSTIRENNLRLAAGEGLTGSDAEALISRQPVIVWLSYNVHGNEPSSSEAAMQVAYRLAAGQDAQTRRYLDEAVVLIDPILNPDGRDRYVYWYRSSQRHVLSTDAADLEHDEPWPGGRTNHYWFDLNRDWVWGVHPESRGRIRQYQRWLPQVHIDYHEQGFNNNYFTHPGTTPRNLLLPDDYDRWSDAFGRADAAAFDEHRVSYFTREAFDFFYPGYGSSYPSLFGSIGMLREQGGHSRGGRAVETNDGYVLTLRQRVFDHYTTSFAALETSVTHREELLRYFRDSFLPAAKKTETAAYLFPPDAGPYLHDVLSLFLRHGVEVERATEPFTARGARDYWDNSPGDERFPEGTFILRADQPKHLFVSTLMERDMAIEDSVMYDMATWSVPFAYNLRAFAAPASPRVRTAPVTSPPARLAEVVNPRAQVAYVVDWKQRHAPRALAMLWNEGYRVRSARKAFGDGTREFSEGSLIVLLGRNEDRLAEAPQDMARIAREAGVQIIGMNSGRMESGIDLASSDARPVERPRVLLMVDRPFSSYTAGQLWYVFDRETHLPVTRLRTSSLGSVDLGEYDVLVLPGASSDGLRAMMDSTATARLTAWVRAGGTLVATENSAMFLTKEASGFTGVEQASDEEDADSTASPDPAVYTRFAAREDSSGLARIPGSAFRARVDTSHPLAFGLAETLYSLRQSTASLEPAEGMHTVGYYDLENPLAAGYASAENQRKLAGKAFAAVQPMGRGRVVFLVDNTQYRMFWLGPMRMVQNATMLLPGM